MNRSLSAAAGKNYQSVAVGEPSVPPASLTRGTVFSSRIHALTLQSADAQRSHLYLTHVLDVAQRWRESIISNSNDLPDRLRSLLSGHHDDGSPLDAPHLAFLPMPAVGHPHADGRLERMSMVFPRDVSDEDRDTALRSIEAVDQLLLGPLGRWHVVAETPRAAAAAGSMRSRKWMAYPEGATQWSTVTPVVFDRHSKAKTAAAHQRESSAMIARACTRIGLPEPRDVILTDVSAHFGVPASFAFPKLRRKDGSERRHRHVILVFNEAVCGPVLIGAGRYRGYGVCRPFVDVVS